MLKIGDTVRIKDFKNMEGYEEHEDRFFRTKMNTSLSSSRLKYCNKIGIITEDAGFFLD